MKADGHAFALPKPAKALEREPAASTSGKPQPEQPETAGLKPSAMREAIGLAKAGTTGGTGQVGNNARGASVHPSNSSFENRRLRRAGGRSKAVQSAPKAG